MNAFLIVFLIFIAIILILVGLFLITGLGGSPYVPTERKDLEEVFTKLCPLKKTDLLIDLGAGDGIILEAAARHGARAIGIEINPVLVFLTNRRLFRTLKNRRATMKCHDIYQYKFPQETTVVYAYLSDFMMPKAFAHAQDEADRLGKPLKFIANAFYLKNHDAVKQVGQYYLYELKPKTGSKTS
ncbi:class I SAM-dependent methyltransferase [Candidatus Saccharibacteria bacterium]|nr:class I SAM-dependent methyltransferase [Candidatus Saccharibacteria bacterium]